MNTIREIAKINEQELELGLAGTPASWHAKYAKSAWVYVGNLDHALTEGDVICVLSQYGEIEDFHLVREEDTGKSRGFAFCKYEDARSCVLAVDNFCGIQLCGRSLRVDHVENYRLPKHLAEKEEQAVEGGGGEGSSRTEAGHAYQGQELANEFSLGRGQDLFAPPPTRDDNNTVNDKDTEKAGESLEEKQKRKQEKRRKQEEKQRRKQERDRIRVEREERRRERRARKMTKYKDSDDGNEERGRDDKKRKRERHNNGAQKEGTGSGDESSEKKKHRKERKSNKKHRKRSDSDDE